MTPIPPHPFDLRRRSRSVPLAFFVPIFISALGAAVVTAQPAGPADAPDAARTADSTDPIRCANLIYGRDKTSVCFSAHFMLEVERHMDIRTERSFRAVRLDSDELFEHPFAVMTGEGAFTLTEPQRRNLRRHLTSGGFLVASAGCSNEPWITSFRREIAEVLPDSPLKPLPADHRIFRTVYDLDRLRTKQRGLDATLEAIELEGRIVAVFSPDGLNDTANAGGDCCCCGGNEVLDASKVNVNLLAYALTH